MVLTVNCASPRAQNLLSIRSGIGREGSTSVLRCPGLFARIRHLRSIPGIREFQRDRLLGYFYRRTDVWTLSVNVRVGTS
jgi:hypothetical protein